MKSLMYHYVRPTDVDLPHMRYLHIENFEKQLDWLEQEYGFIRKEDFDKALFLGGVPDGIVLTFDDGLKDHFDYVFKTLKRKKLWGLFYITTGIYKERKLLDVHRVHYILGKIGGINALGILKDIINPDMLVKKDVQIFEGRTYNFQDNDTATKDFKHCLNYDIDAQHRRHVLELILNKLKVDEGSLFNEYYMSSEDIKSMHENGMHIGSHAETHTVLSKLSSEQQFNEIRNSSNFLQGIINERITSFAYPYGGFHTFTDVTEGILEDQGIKFSWNVEPRDVVEKDIQARPLALPRFDCNMFPYGKAHYGTKAPDQNTP